MRATSTSLEDWCKQTGHHDVLDNYNRGNNELSASEISRGSGKRVQWKCKNDKHSLWSARVSSVTAKASGCPTCAGKRVEPGVNDLLTLFPQVCKDWDYSKNKDVDIRSLTPGSQRNVWWKCSICGKEWQHPVIFRTNSIKTDIAGCGDCRRANSITFSQSLEDWCRQTNHFDILEDYNRGGNSTPASEIGKGSQQQVQWKCPKTNHPAWTATISNRTNPKKPRGCPICGNKLLVPGINDFETLFPDIAKEWDYAKNYPTTPADVFPGNNTTWYWWRCKNNHSFKAKVNNRTSPQNRTGCPYCSNHKVWTGFNDLETWCRQNNFDILIQEYSTKNKHPMSDVLYGHDGKVWWDCSVCGNHYQSNVYYRTKGIIGCDKCNKSMRSSFPEQAIFFYIKQLFPDAINSYQEIFENRMELDIYIPAKKVGIEYDGVAWHNSEKSANKEREKYNICKKHNITLLRVREKGLEEIKGTCDAIIISNFNSRNYLELDNAVHEIINYLGYNSIEVDSAKDTPQILNNYIHTKKKNNLQEIYPELTKDWDYSKNGQLKPSMVKAHSARKVWWKCQKGHPSYLKSIDSRTRGVGCPLCSTRKTASGKIITMTKHVISGKNDILTLFPEVCKDWDYSMNTNIDIRTIPPGSGKKVWWKCQKGHPSYMCSIGQKTSKKTGCPYCSGMLAVPGENDILTLFPEACKDWDYDSNKDIDITTIKPHSGKKVWWKCSFCGKRQEQTPAKHFISRNDKDVAGCGACRHKQHVSE